MIGQNGRHHYTQANTNNTIRHDLSYKQLGANANFLEKKEIAPVKNIHRMYDNSICI